VRRASTLRASWRGGRQKGVGGDERAPALRRSPPARAGWMDRSGLSFGLFDRPQDALAGELEQGGIRQGPRQTPRGLSNDVRREEPFGRDARRDSVCLHVGESTPNERLGGCPAELSPTNLLENAVDPLAQRLADELSSRPRPAPRLHLA